MGRRKNITADKSIIWKVALYIRLSKEDGNDVSLSVKNQTEALNEYVDNCDEPFNIENIYIDDGRTGTDSDRPYFQQMLLDIKSGKINCVIVKDLSRLSRNYAEAGLYLEQYFVENNVRFISLNLPKLDSYLNPDEISSIATAMQNVINDDFCRQTSLKIKGIFNVKRSKGLFIGAFAPYGYIKNPENKYHLIVDEDVADIVKNIFQWFNEGMSKRGITNRLNDLGVLNPSEYKRFTGLNYKNPNYSNFRTLWSPATIDTILKNQMYLGDMIQGKGKVKSYKIHKHVKVPEEEWFIVPNTHEAIIDKETFYKTQELLKRDTKTANKSGTVYLFSGLIRCADCKKAMHKSKTGKYQYYVCRTYKEQSKTACTKHTIRSEELEKSVLYAINAQLSLVEEIENMIDEIQKAPVTKNALSTITKAVKSKKLELSQINRIRDGLYSDWKDNTITRDDYLRLRQSYDEQLEALKNSLQSLESELETFNKGISTDTPYFDYYKKYKCIDKLERSILLELIDTIYVSEGGKIEIEFRFADQQKQLLSLIQSNEKQKTKKFVL